jgi:hypothetical protein
MLLILVALVGVGLSLVNRWFSQPEMLASLRGKAQTQANSAIGKKTYALKVSLSSWMAFLIVMPGPVDGTGSLTHFRFPRVKLRRPSHTCSNMLVSELTMSV